MESAKRPRIGFLALDLTNTFNELLLDGVRNRCNELELELVVFHGGRLGAPEEVESTQNLLYNFIPEAELDGLLFSNVFSFMDQDEIDLFFSRLPDIPKVFLNPRYKQRTNGTSPEYHGFHPAPRAPHFRKRMPKIWDDHRAPPIMPTA
jgi:DNA-binding LacI/PurR family transcriptional regulator